MIKKALRLFKRLMLDSAWRRKLIMEAAYLRGFYRLEVEEDLAFFDCFWGRKIGGDPYALYREMVRQNPSLRCIWVRNPGVGIPDDVSGNPRVSFVEHGSRQYADALLRARYLVCNSNFLPMFVKRPGQLFVNTWHGTPLKTLGLDINQPVNLSLNTQRNFNIADFIPLSGAYERRYIVDAYGGAGFKENVYEVGAPRLDLTLSADGIALRRELGVPAKRKVILYAPTWRGSIEDVSAQVDDQVNAVKVLKEQEGDEYHLFVSLHHLTKQQVTDLGVEVDYVPDSLDINEFLQCVDVLVSDYSSITVDYLILDRPVVLYVPDYENYRVERGLYLGLESLPCEICFDLSELPTVVRDARRPSAFKPWNSLIATALPMAKGGASCRLVESVFASARQKIASKPERKSVLIYPGALKNNGITAAFKSLISFLSSNGVDVYVLVDIAFERSVDSFVSNLEFCREHAKVILADRAGLQRFREYFLIHKLRKAPSKLSKQDEHNLSLMFERAVRRFIPDVVFDCAIDFSGYSFYWSRFIASVPAKNKLVYQHSDMKAEFDNPNRGHVYLDAVFGGYKHFDGVASVSHASRAINEQNLGHYYGRANAMAIPNTVDFARISLLAEEPVGSVCPEVAKLPSNVKMFISVSRLSHEKNIASLIQAFSQLANTHDDAVLVIVGDGDERERLAACAVSEGVADKVIFTGNLDNPYPLMKRADCLVFPSLYEGQGLVLLEAMSLGTFCIGSDISAVNEVLEGTGCWVVPPVAADLRAAMTDFLEKRPCSIDFETRKYLDYAGGQLWSALFPASVSDNRL
ncbi:glycosyltransferase [Marinobacter litoralis]|uniref:glycosyltransferase n=1 Tax=Marinobacter litoralis TaxID=187981 RepID=UPI0018ED87E9|nr:glycosyltransferase [Marinobacter litoralis]MBJ6137356.1 CDP-glycerol glycerophosphotransferase family protein [Marinobacter litoralis]